MQDCKRGTYFRAYTKAMMNKLATYFRSLMHVLAAFTSNCTHFEREWQQASGIETADLEGSWQGEWVSDANGHRGQLKCVLTRSDAQHYRACFHATYAKLLRVCYCVPLAGAKSAGRFRLQGETDLGKLAGGVYRYEGEASGEEFLVTYRCRYDRGIFRLRRRRPHLRS
jgi:hypothetical protein